MSKTAVFEAQRFTTDFRVFRTFKIPCQNPRGFGTVMKATPTSLTHDGLIVLTAIEDTQDRHDLSFLIDLEGDCGSFLEGDDP